MRPRCFTQVDCHWVKQKEGSVHGMSLWSLPPCLWRNRILSLAVPSTRLTSARLRLDG